MTDSSQKFIARNRAPRVQIEYDVELYGAEKKVQLPFVMGVMSDLAGKSNVAQPAIADRSFLEIDVDNFDDRMRAMAPRAAFTVPNTLTGEGNISVDLTFEKMDDFSPAAIASKVDSLRPLLEARAQLSDLMAYMDGKAGAETLIEKILSDPALLSAVSAAPDRPRDQSGVLDGLRALTPQDAGEPDETGNILADLKSGAPSQAPEANTTASVLADLAGQAANIEPPPDSDTATLDGLRAAAPRDAEPDTATRDTLGALAAGAPEPEVAEDVTADVLADLASAAPGDLPGPDTTADVLDGLAAVEVPAEVDDATDDLLADLASAAPEDLPEPDTAADVLDGLAAVEVPAEVDDATDDLLADLASAAPGDLPGPDTAAEVLDGLAAVEVPAEVDDSTDDLLADLASAAPGDLPGPDTTADVLDGLADVDLPEEAQDTTDSLLADLAAEVPEPTETPYTLTEALDSLADAGPPEPVEDTADALPAELEMPKGPDGLSVDPGGLVDTGSDDLPGDAEAGDSDPLDDLLGQPGSGDDDGGDGPGDDRGGSDLDALLGELGGDDDGGDGPGDDGGDSDLDALLGELGGDDDGGLDDLLADTGGDGDDSDLDALLGGLDDDVDPPEQAGQGASVSDEPEFAYGRIGAERPEPARLNRRRFRLAILGDFSGRAARGQMETGDALAARKPILLDPDTAEDVIEGFATDLVLPIGKDGAGVAVKLGGLDDLHPDELYENVELFGELNGLRGQLASGATAENAARNLRAWGEKHGQYVAPAKLTSSGNAVPADCKLSDFQKLIGDTGATLAQVSPLDDLMARIVGPHIRAIPDADAMAMKGAVDQALSAAMRLILHHPEFQMVESQWRSVDLIARSIETDDTLDVMLYDVSAAEIAADLAASQDLEQSGFARLLTEEPLDEENGRGGYSALIGLYTFEETPPHAELLGRIARVAAHVDAPFFAAITPAFLDTPKEDRHKLVREAWETLRAMPEAGHLGLVSPRFLLRRPYGAKSEPIYEFEFEEFTMAEGLKGMLWANPVVLVAILLAKSFRENGASMSLGSIMSLGDIPFHYVNDRYGDQVALPCTERNLTLDKIEMAVTRGIMSVAAIKGRDEIRLTSFGSVAGGEILGPWTGAPPPKPSPPKPEPAAKSTEVVDSDDETGDDIDLDDLLAGYSDDTDDGGEIDDTDAELAALLGDL